MNDPEDTINNSKSGRRAAMARDGRLDKATAATQPIQIDDMIRMAKSAPKMLAALQSIQRVFAQYGDGIFGQYAKDVRAAIADATGAKS
jgi:hypothetical protein